MKIFLRSFILLISLATIISCEKIPTGGMYDVSDDYTLVDYLEGNWAAFVEPEVFIGLGIEKVTNSAILNIIFDKNRKSFTEIRVLMSDTYGNETTNDRYDLKIENNKILAFDSEENKFITKYRILDKSLDSQMTVDAGIFGKVIFKRD